MWTVKLSGFVGIFTETANKLSIPDTHTHDNSCCHAIKAYQSKSGFSSFCFLPGNDSQMFSIYLSMSLMCIFLPLTATDVSCLSQFCCCTSISWDALLTITALSGGLSPEPAILYLCLFWSEHSTLNVNISSHSRRLIFFFPPQM